MSNNYILIPHFYRLNWAKEMSQFLKNSEGFEYLGKDFEYSNYSKACKLRDEYLDSLIDTHTTTETKSLFFVNLNDYIFFERRFELRNKFDIYGLMRGSRFFDGEPGNCAFDKNGLEYMQKMESEALCEVNGIFLGSQAFGRFLFKKIPNLQKDKVNIIGIPIFMEPYYLNKTDLEIKTFEDGKDKDLIIWNHRLQKQKNPWVLFELEKFIKNKISICTPEALSAAYSKEMKENEIYFKNIIRDNGKKRNLYLNELKKAKFALSTSQHETWGNSMIEAVMNGAIPIAPDGADCSYSELFPQEFLYPQSLIHRDKNVITREDNMIQLSYLIDEITRINYSKELRDLQGDLWNRFNFKKWLENLKSYLFIDK